MAIQHFPPTPQNIFGGLDSRQLLSEKGQPGGYAGLNGEGLLPKDFIPLLDNKEVVGSRGLATTDYLGLLRFTATANTTLTVPLNGGEFKKGFFCLLWTEGAGELTVDVADTQTTTLLANLNTFAAPNTLAFLVNLDGGNLWALVQLTGGGNGGSGTLVEGDPIIWDMRKSANAEVTLTGVSGDRTIEIINSSPGSYALTIRQDNTGNKTPILSCATHTIKWSRSLLPPWSLSPYAVDVVTFVVPDTNSELLGGFLEQFGAVS